MGVFCGGYVLWGYSVEIMCHRGILYMLCVMGVCCRGYVLWGYAVEVMCYGGIL